MKWLIKYGWIWWLSVGLMGLGHTPFTLGYWVIYLPVVALGTWGQDYVSKESARNALLDLKKDVQGLREESKRESYRIGQWAEDKADWWSRIVARIDAHKL